MKVQLQYEFFDVGIPAVVPAAGVLIGIYISVEAIPNNWKLPYALLHPTETNNSFYEMEVGLIDQRMWLIKQKDEETCSTIITGTEECVFILR